MNSDIYEQYVSAHLPVIFIYESFSLYIVLTRAHLSRRSEEEEEFLVLPEQSPDALELMKERRDRLQRGEPVRAQLDRQPQAFRPSPNAQRFELPPEFYNLTAEELKREQQQRYRLTFNPKNGSNSSQL